MSTTVALESRIVSRWCDAVECCDSAWEAAYHRFESPAAERRKFHQRFRTLGVEAWPRDWRILELCCGRGNGLRVLEELGFSQLLGVDLSAALLEQYRGCAELHVGDCRHLQLDDMSVDAVVVQGGLHHLPDWKRDLPATLDEVWRVLRPGGKLLIVEPWTTPFLNIVHGCCRRPLVRRLWSRLDALQEMIEHEAETYFRWLSHPAEIRSLLTSACETECLKVGFGKLMFVGRKAASITARH